MITNIHDVTPGCIVMDHHEIMFILNVLQHIQAVDKKGEGVWFFGVKWSRLRDNAPVIVTASHFYLADSKILVKA